MNTKKLKRKQPLHALQKAAQWMKDNIPPKEIITGNSADIFAY